MENRNIIRRKSCRQVAIEISGETLPTTLPSIKDSNILTSKMAFAKFVYSL
jgi:hypothetical protein